MAFNPATVGSALGGVDLALNRARALRDAIADPAEYQRNRVTAMEALQTSSRNRFAAKYQEAVNDGYAPDAARAYAERATSGFMAFELQEFNNRWPQDPLRIAMSINLKETTGNQVAFGAAGAEAPHAASRAKTGRRKAKK